MSAPTASVHTSDKSKKVYRWRIVGNVAVVLLVAVTTLWAYWGMAEMYYEGWWGEWTNRLPYLIPGTAFLLLSLLIIRWPRLGGWLLILLGGGFTAFYWSVQFSRWGFNWEAFLSMFPVSGLLVLLGVCFVLAGSAQRHYPQVQTPSSAGRWAFVQRNWRYLLAVGLPLLVAIVVSAINVPIILARVDDGDRGAQLVIGNGVTLVWAPAGPGWGRGMLRADQKNFNQPGAVLSWNEIALYGRPPIGVGDKPGFVGLACDSSTDAGCATQVDMAATGLCRYLSADGLQLQNEPQDIWRMPTVDEMVRSLARHGANSGCTWDGKTDSAECAITPDKEPPLWDPDSSAVYYWAADEYNLVEAYYINYNGNAVHSQPKSFGNARHGYRCVREPE
ncbi:MAG: hypothetical protein CL608_16020 [Anaerolineaceae bacterium]|nr:hypothetical protein [Anaerolineaceae bacterium]